MLCVGFFFFFCFFFKQKAAYVVLRSLVGSEMCIRDRRVTLLHVLPPGSRPADQVRARQVMDYALEGLSYDAVHRQTVEGTNVVDAVLEAAEGHDLIVIGATEEPLFKNLLAGNISREVARRAEVSVVVVKRRSSALHSLLRQTVLEPTTSDAGPDDADARARDAGGVRLEFRHARQLAHVSMAVQQPGQLGDFWNIGLTIKSRALDIQTTGQPSGGNLQARALDAQRVIALDQRMVVRQEIKRIGIRRAAGNDCRANGAGVVAKVRSASGGDAGQNTSGHGLSLIGWACGG